jgi:hypothetical protein
VRRWSREWPAFAHTSLQRTCTHSGAHVTSIIVHASMASPRRGRRPGPGTLARTRSPQCREWGEGSRVVRQGARQQPGHNRSHLGDPVRICLSEFVCDVMRPRSNAWTARHARTGQHARRGVLHVRRPAHRASQDITPTSSSLSATAPLLGLLSDANLSPSPASIFFLARLPALIKSRHTHGRSTEPARVDPGARQNNSPGS